MIDLTNILNKNTFWIDDPSILFSDGKYKEVIPTADMSRVEQLNAITRLAIYIFLVFLIFGFTSLIFIPIVVIIFVIALYYIYLSDPDGKRKDFFNERAIYTENFGVDNQIIRYTRPNDEIVVGNYDSNGNLYFDDKKEDEIKNLYFTTDEIHNYNEATCKRPTADNPFMNPSITEYNTFNPPVACNADNEEIKALIEEKFNANLFMDIDDLYDMKNSQRQFYTIPMPAIPNDQTEFANWLYRNETTCKENQDQCLRYEDLRFKRHL